METTSAPSQKLDKLLWLLVSILIAAGIFANYYFSEVVWSLRFTGWIFLICVLVGLVAITTQGKRLWVFTKEARIELLKVVWPKRDETVKITMVIAALVIAASIIMWGLDSVLLWAVGWLTKQLV